MLTQDIDSRHSLYLGRLSPFFDRFSPPLPVVVASEDIDISGVKGQRTGDLTEFVADAHICLLQARSGRLLYSLSIDAYLDL